MKLGHLKGATVLVAEDNMLIALDLAFTLEDNLALVMGPCPRVSDALRLIDGAHVDGAILDVDLLDGSVTPLAEALIAKGVPIVFCTGAGLPPDLRSKDLSAPVVLKPAEPQVLLQKLDEIIGSKADSRL